MSNHPYKWYDVSSRAALQHTARLGSRWFYVIAGLSLINTLLQYGGAPVRLALGLAITQVIDGILGSTFPQLYYLSLVIDVVIAAAFIGFGYLSGRGDVVVFIVGLVLYLIDTFPLRRANCSRWHRGWNCCNHLARCSRLLRLEGPSSGERTQNVTQRRRE